MWHVWETGEVLMGLLLGDVKETEHLEDLSIHGKITLKCIFKNWGGKEWTGVVWLSMGLVMAACDCGNVPSGSWKYGEPVD
jgi:hypothetical protein